MVGERGPELMAAPVGSRILSHNDMMRAARGNISSGSFGLGFSTAPEAVNPVFNIHVTGAGMDPELLVQKLKGPFSNWMAGEFRKARR